jgi:hypothetical protein
MLKYNVEITLTRAEPLKVATQLEVRDVSLEAALNYVKNFTAENKVLDARIIDETGRQIRLPNFN